MASSTPFAEYPPKPRLTLRVGITGKRQIPEAERARIDSTLSDVFDALAVHLADCRERHRRYFSNEPPQLRITTGMAEGADQIAAKIALAHHERHAVVSSPNVETSVAAILPFARDEFEKDFRVDPNRPAEQRIRSEEEWNQANQLLRALIARDAVESVLEIDDEALLQANRPEFRSQAYPNLGDVLLDHSDILVAVSDDIDGGPGGTVDVMRNAMGRGIPVIKVSTKRPEVYVMHPAPIDEPDQSPREHERFIAHDVLPSDLADALVYLLPPSIEDIAKDDPHSEDSTVHHLDVYFRERFSPVYFGGLFRAFRDVLTIGGWGTRRERVTRLLDILARALRDYRVSTPLDSASSIWPEAFGPLTNDGGTRARKILAERFGWADALAVQYADATRSCYVGAVFLGSIAILVGFLPFLVPEQHATKALVAALLVEWAILAIVALVFVRPPLAHRWQERMTDYRAIADGLRQLRFLYLLGSANRLTPTALGGEQGSWVAWYVNSTMRELGIPWLRLSAEHRRHVLTIFRRTELEEIATYYEITAARYRLIDQRLKRAASAAFLVIFSALPLGLIGLGALFALAWFGWLDRGNLDSIVRIATPWPVLAITSGLYLIAAIYVLRLQLNLQETAEQAAAGSDLFKFARQSATVFDATLQPGRKSAVAFLRTLGEAQAAADNQIARRRPMSRRRGP